MAVALFTHGALSTETFIFTMFGEPETVPVSRADGKPLPPNVPTHAAVPLYLGEKAQEFTLMDAQDLILSGLGESFAPAKAMEQRPRKDRNTLRSKRAPESFLEPEAALSYPSYVWSLGMAI
ncbi:hypothetical protein HRG_014473 [Hirsutella rhossiliensis]